MIKGWVIQENITILSMYAPNIRTSKKYVTRTNRTSRRNRQIIIIFDDFNTPLSVIDRWSKQKTNRYSWSEQHYQSTWHF